MKAKTEGSSMRKLLVLIAVSAFALAACGSGSEAVLSPAGAQDGTVGSGIHVTGQGKVTGKPDTMTLNIGVSVLRDTVDKATGDAATLANSMLEAIKAKGVAGSDIQTSNYSISPEYDYTASTPKIIGYRVTNTLTVKIRDLATAGQIIDAATATGGNDAVVNGVSFSIEDNAELLQAARTAAWGDAEAKATQLAQLAGLQLGAAVSITESVVNDVPPIYFDTAARSAAGEGATPIQPGQLEVTVMVDVTFNIGS
jgi:uncharacterized protein YggE